MCSLSNVVCTNDETKRRRCLHPVVRERQSLVNQLQAILRDLGLERKAQAVPTLDEYLRGRHPPDPAA